MAVTTLQLRQICRRKCHPTTPCSAEAPDRGPGMVSSAEHLGTAVLFTHHVYHRGCVSYTTFLLHLSPKPYNSVLQWTRPSVGAAILGDLITCCHSMFTTSREKGCRHQFTQRKHINLQRGALTHPRSLLVSVRAGTKPRRLQLRLAVTEGKVQGPSELTAACSAFLER